jgi:hypothetical protein
MGIEPNEKPKAHQLPPSKSDLYKMYNPSNRQTSTTATLVSRVAYPRYLPFSATLACIYGE